MTFKFEARFYDSLNFSERSPRLKTGSQRVLQLCCDPMPCRIVNAADIKDGAPDERPDGDALWADISPIPYHNPILETYAADCINAAVQDARRYGVIHFGWKELGGDFLNEFLELFDPATRQIVIAPFLHRFNIQKDWAYQQIIERLGAQVVTTGLNRDGWKHLVKRPIATSFNFRRAVEDTLAQERVYLHPDSTADSTVYASMRRGGYEHCNVLRIGLDSSFACEDAPTAILPWPNAA